MASTFIKSFRAEPAAANPPGPLPRDWALAAIIVIVAAGEALFRTDLSWPVPSMIVAWVGAVTFPWRRVYPLAACAIPMVGISAITAGSIAFLDGPPVGTYVSATVLIHIYAVFRWASGRHAMMALALMAVLFVLANIDDWTGIGEAIAGLFIFLFPAELGGLVRYRQDAGARKVDQVRSLERERLARELHDTVAHHVSAIAIQAQAGQAMAATKPEAALELLAVIEDEASRTLTEMRSMVGSLRDHNTPAEDPDLAPQQNLSNLEELASTGLGGEAAVDIQRYGPTDQLSQPVSAALYRIAQESITNATRHGTDVNRIDVVIDATSESDVTLTVRDDGRSPQANGTVAGYGLIGMAERAQLLGGAFEAGPTSERGWAVMAKLPKQRASQ